MWYSLHTCFSLWRREGFTWERDGDLWGTERDMLAGSLVDWMFF